MAVFTFIAGAIGASVASVVLTVASVAYQMYRTNKLKQELDKRKQVNIAVDGEPFYLPVVYGRAKVSGGKVLHKLKDGYAFANEPGLTKQVEGPFYSLSSPASYFKEVAIVETSQSLPYTSSVTSEIMWNGVQKLFPSPNSYLSSLVNYLFTNSIVNVGTQAYSHSEATDGYTYERGAKVTSSSTVETYDSGGVTYTRTTTTSFYRITRYANVSKQVFSHNLQSSKSGSKNEYLFLQQAICYGGINRVVDITVDDKNWDDETLKFGQRIVVDLNGGTASSLATANGLPSTNTFTNTAYATMCFRLNREEYNYNGSPNVSFFVQGMKISDITYDSLSDTLSVTSEKKYTNNPALVLLDYLTNPVYGKGLSLDVIDLRSFFVAKLLCSTLVAKDLARDGRINGRRPDVEKEDGTITSQPQLPPYAIPLYECNVVIDTERSLRENVELILESMDEADLIWSGGTYKLVMYAPRTNDDISELISAQITEDDIIRGGIELEFPDSSTRYNQCVARFMNEFENYVDDTVTWPPAYSDAYDQYLEEDSGTLLKTEIYLPCTSDPYHALAKAEQIVRTSRRQMRAKLTVGKKGLLLEPGDIITITDASSGLNQEVMKIESVKQQSDLTTQIEARQYDFSTFAWNVPDDVPYISQKLDYVYSIAKPSVVVFTPENTTSIFGVTSGKLTWTYPDSVSVSQFIVEISQDSGSTWQTLATTLAPSYDIVGLNTGVYQFAVRSVGQDNRFSERVLATDVGETTDSFTIQRATSDQVAVIYGSTSDEETNLQSYDPSGYEYVAYYVYSGDLPTLPVTSGISFSKFSGNDGVSTYQASIFKRDISTPTTPTGGSYSFTTQTLTPPSGWFASVPSGSGVLYTTTALASISGTEGVDDSLTWVTPTAIAQDGTSGLSNAVVSLYNKNTSSSAAPTSFTGTATYTFATGMLSGLTLNGWSQNAPSLTNGEYLWVRQALASSINSTDTITISEWSTAVKLGIGGVNGLNSVPLFLYTKTSSISPPSSFTGTANYSFSTDSLTGLTLNGWSRTIPSLSSGEYLWVRQAIASSSTGTDTIGIGEWSTAAIIGLSGSIGTRGAGWWRYDAGSADLTTVTTTASVNVYWEALHNPDLPAVQGDRFIIATTHSSGTKAFIYDGLDWVTQAAFIDGNLLVAGTITGNKIAANSITSDKLSVSSLSAVSATIGILQSAPSGARLVIQDDKISVFDANNRLRFKAGNLL